MIREFTVRSFKSLEDVTVELGQVNVFIGANGSGKSNLLEAIGVLSAAAEGRVTDQTLLHRGVRPGVPKLYKSSFPSNGRKSPPHIFFSAAGDGGRYEVSLHNPLDDPLPAWRYKTERWHGPGDEKLVGRSPAMRKKSNPEQGLAALTAVEVDEDAPALTFLRAVQEYVIYAPTTAVLRGTAPETEPRNPIGLSGGRLAEAVQGLLRQRYRDDWAKKVCRESLSLIDWATRYGSSPSAMLPLSPSAASSPQVIRFVDKYMAPNRNVLSGYDASEGALFVLFLAVVAAHKASPRFCAVDNADHGLNPRLACALMRALCEWYTSADEPRQILLTTHNPLVLDGLMLEDDRVRLFAVDRSRQGRTIVQRVVLDEKLRKLAREKEWSLSRLWVMGQIGGVPNV